MNQKSELALARKAARDGKVKEAEEILLSILSNSHYPKTIRNAANDSLNRLAQHKEGNRAQEKSAPTDIRDLVPEFKPYRCMVISWDTNHNCLGRSYLLYTLLKPIFQDTILAGFDFKHIGKETWEPLRVNGFEPIKLKEPKDARDLFRICRIISKNVETDCVVVSKPRLPSLLLGCLIKHYKNVPLIVDSDDYELGFVKSDETNGLLPVDLNKQFHKRLDEVPYSPFWTQYAEYLLYHADEVITSNKALSSLYGGLIVPHARERAGKQVDVNSNRIYLNVPDTIRPDCKKIVFLGTPRRHKGVLEVARACREITDFAIQFVIVGSFDDKALKNDVAEAGGKMVVMIENIPFDQISNYLSMADLVVLIQDPTSLSSMFQLPAKAIDALALNKHILCSGTRPMHELRDIGFKHIHIKDETLSLSSQIIRILTGKEAEKIDMEEQQALFDSVLSPSACTETLRKAIDNAVRRRSLTRTKYYSAPIGELQFLSEISIAEKSSINASTQTSKNEGNRIVVMLWKQNDFGLFGRRIDMIASHMATIENINKVIIIEKSLTTLDLKKIAGSSDPHRQLIYTSFREKQIGLIDTKKISVLTQCLEAGLSESSRAHAEAAFIQEKISNIILQSGLKNPEIDLWIYPFIKNATLIAKSIRPDRIIVDVVDNHTKWSGISQGKQIEILKNYQEILSISDYTIFNCQKTLDELGIFCRHHKEVIANAIDPNVSRLPVDQDLKKHLLEKYECDFIIGYAGNLEQKIDWDLILKISADLPRCLLLLVGSSHMARTLPLRPNICYTGPIKYDNLGRYLGIFDVATIPHIVSDFTSSMNPLKVYCYALFGYDIISTAIDNLPSQDDLPLLKVCYSHAEFIRSLKESLASPSVSESPFKHSGFIEKNTWQRRLSSSGLFSYLHLAS